MNCNDRRVSLTGTHVSRFYKLNKNMFHSPVDFFFFLFSDKRNTCCAIYNGREMPYLNKLTKTLHVEIIHSSGIFKGAMKIRKK